MSACFSAKADVQAVPRERLMFGPKRTVESV